MHEKESKLASVLAHSVKILGWRSMNQITHTASMRFCWPLPSSGSVISEAFVGYKARRLTGIAVLYLAFWGRENVLLMRIGKISNENHETHTWLLLAQTIFLFMMFNHVLEFLPHYLRETTQKHTFIQHENSALFRALLVSKWISTDDYNGLSDQNWYFILVFMFLTMLPIFPNCKWLLHFYIQHKGYFYFFLRIFFFSLSLSLVLVLFLLNLMHCFQELWLEHHLTNPAHYYALSTAACCNAIFTLWH